VAEVVDDLKASGEPVPDALADKTYSGRLLVRIPASVHRTLATEAAEQGISLNRLVSAKLTA
jgi:predicted HicB family RNase H-like nuclease